VTQAAAASNGQDYSAQWADYYRSIGKHAEAEAIEKQLKQKVREDKVIEELTRK
jgi:far upstream element-binding protein